MNPIYYVQEAGNKIDYRSTLTAEGCCCATN